MTAAAGGTPDAAPAPLLELDGVHTYYGDSHILQGVSLRVLPGQVTCLIGRNGAGKTTTVRTVMGFSPPRGGRVVYAGRPITGAPPHRVARLGVALVPQGRGIFPELTVGEHLALAFRPGGWTAAQTAARFPALAARERQRAGVLSGGEQQMLAIARALAMAPRLVVLDEPSDGLAPRFVAAVRDMLREMRAAGLGILLVEQNLALARAAAERLYVLNKGRVVFEGTPADLDASPEVRRQYLGV
ncbi:MAG TPA: ABC transporter ATP-binding protein [bacterium]|nr:ABC transporter ATP-binding protein [bacterium]